MDFFVWIRARKQLLSEAWGKKWGIYVKGGKKICKKTVQFSSLHSKESILVKSIFWRYTRANLNSYVHVANHNSVVWVWWKVFQNTKSDRHGMHWFFFLVIFWSIRWQTDSPFSKRKGLSTAKLAFELSHLKNVLSMHEQTVLCILQEKYGVHSWQTGTGCLVPV